MEQALGLSLGWLNHGGPRKATEGLGGFAVIRQDQAAKDRLEGEVQDQADFDRGSAEVVNELRFVDGLEGAARLQLDDHAAFDQQIGTEVTDCATAVIDDDRSLTN